MAVFRLFKTNLFCNIVNNSRLFYSTTILTRLEYQQSCRTLGVTVDSTSEQIRDAYLELAKLYHPDSGREDANKEKFTKIDDAFKILMSWKTNEKLDVNDEIVEQFDIRHIAPQHRQYLSYGGIGSGTPIEREKQYTKYRAIQATENVLQHRLNKAIAEDGALMLKQSQKSQQHDIKTGYGFDRLVEDLIQEAMSKGKFDNLPGKGKPLADQHNSNPFVDRTTHKINEVLIENGFTPEWITLQKEIKDEIQQLRKDLLNERSRFNESPLNQQEYGNWLECVHEYMKSVDGINKKIDKFNLVVPILNKQLLHVDLYKEADKALINGIPYRSTIKIDFNSEIDKWDDFISSVVKKIVLYLK